MGIVLGVEAVVSAVEAAEAVGTATDVIASGADAAEAIDAGASAGEEAASAASTEAAAAEGGSALKSILSLLKTEIGKALKIFGDIQNLSFVLQTATEILKPQTSDPAVQNRFKKLTKLYAVIAESNKILKEITEWLKNHAQDQIDVKDYVVSLQGILSKFISQLGSATATLTKLGSQVEAKNRAKQPITDGEVDALETGMNTVLKSYKSLADFKNEHQDKIKQLQTMPIDEKMVSNLQKQMP